MSPTSKTKRYIYLITFLAFLTSYAFSQSQDSSRNRLSVTVNIVQLPINEAGIYVDYGLKKRHSFGFGIANVYVNQLFIPDFLSDDQSTFPGAVWHGIAARVNYKAYFLRSRRLYLCIQVLYKSLSYTNQTFINDYDDNLDYFTRNETAYSWGADLLLGHLITGIKAKIDVDVFYGIGWRYRVRNYTTTFNNGDPGAYQQPLGSFQLIQNYPSFVFGIKVGYNFFVGKK